MSDGAPSVCLVTGGSGFIGQRLVRSLVADGVEVRLLARSPRHEPNIVVCDLATDAIPVEACQGVDAVYHLAGYAHDLRDASKLEAVYRSINVDATMRLANACVANGVRRFVFVSSVKAGGPSIGSQARGEGEHYTPEGIYGQTKREAELKLLALAKASGMEVSILRPCLVFGPGVKGNLRSMLTGIEQGWLPPLPGAHNRRSLIHVDDVVRALRLVAHHEDAKGEIFIATGARDYSTQAIYRTLCEVAGKRPPQWSVPKILFDLLARVHPKLDEKVSKLFGDAQYYSTKLQSIGFEAHRDLREIHETMY